MLKWRKNDGVLNNIVLWNMTLLDMFYDSCHVPVKSLRHVMVISAYIYNKTYIERIYVRLNAYTD